MPGIDGDRVTAEVLHTADREGLSTKIKVLTKQADKAILDNMTATEDGSKPTTDLENHINGLAPKSKVKKDAEHYGDGSLPEDDYYVKQQAKKLSDNSKKSTED